MPWFYDFTSSFDTVESEVYIDSGHLNPIGNTIIAMKIAELLNSASASWIEIPTPSINESISGTGKKEVDDFSQDEQKEESPK